MRLFVAIDVGDAARAQLENVRRQIEPRIASARQPAKLTWAAGDRAHVTLRFMGEVPDAAAAQVRAALTAPFLNRPFEIRWDTVGAFPNARRPRVIWLGGSVGQAKMAALAQAVNARVDPIVGPGEDREFRAHLTIARVREPGRVDWSGALAATAPGASVSRVDRVTLYQSHLSPKGPTYTALVTTPLIDGAV